MSEPLTPPDCDLRDQPWFPLYVDKLAGSRWWRKASHVARSINVDLWLAAWSEIPAASLPDDDVELALLAGFGRGAGAVEEWKKVRDEVLEPWRRTSGGRLYHPTLSEVANEAWQRKLERNAAREADAERKRAARAALQNKDNPRSATSKRRPAAVRSITDTDTDTDTTPPKAPQGAARGGAEAGGVNWAKRVDELHAECGGLLDRSSPQANNAAPLRRLVEVEGIAWEDVRDAVIAIVKTRGTKSKPIRSFGFSAILDMAHANHERRNGVTTDGKPNSDGRGVGGLLGAKLRRQSRNGNGGKRASFRDAGPRYSFDDEPSEGDGEAPGAADASV